MSTPRPRQTIRSRIKWFYCLLIYFNNKTKTLHTKSYINRKVKLLEWSKKKHDAKMLCIVNEYRQNIKTTYIWKIKNNNNNNCRMNLVLLRTIFTASTHTHTRAPECIMQCCFLSFSSFGYWMHLWGTCHGKTVSGSSLVCYCPSNWNATDPRSSSSGLAKQPKAKKILN